MAIAPEHAAAEYADVAMQQEAPTTENSYPSTPTPEGTAIYIEELARIRASGVIDGSRDAFYIEELARLRAPGVIDPTTGTERRARDPRIQITDDR
jgi:hypothetical protein